MNSRRKASRGGSTSGTTLSRRSLLAASGIVILGGLSGCLSRVASATTNTTAAPAGVFMRSADGFTAGTPHVARLTPTLTGDVGGVSGEIELEGWVTAVAISAANYNNTRSNKAGVRAEDEDTDADADGDGAGDGTGGARANYNNTRSNRSSARPPDILGDLLAEMDETFRTVTGLDDELRAATAAAWASISKRSARTGRNPQTEKDVTAALDEMDEILAEMRAVLERCSEDACAAAVANVVDRQADTRRARQYAENGEWDAFGLTDGVGDDLLLGDYFLPPLAFDPSGMFNPATQAALFRYFDETSVIGERFTVCLPDAEVPGGNGSLREAVTPERLIEYVTGGSDDGGQMYSWGAVTASSGSPDEAGDCDDSDERARPAVCGTTPHFVAEASGPMASGGQLAVVRAEEGSVVLTIPSNQDGSDAGVCAPGGGQGRVGMLTMRACDPGVWPEQTEAGASTGLLVYQMMVRPPACPEPFPALLYVQRCENDSQLIYTGGWIIDDASLYGNSLTLVSMGGATSVDGIDVGDVDGDRLTDLGDSFEDVAGGQMSAGPVEQLVAAGVLSRELVEGDDSIVRKRPGRTEESDSAMVSGDEYGFVTNIDAAASLLHLVNAGGASNEVKFKAGAALSGQVG